MNSHSRYAGFYPFPAVMLDGIYTTGSEDPNLFYKRMSENLVDFVTPSYRLRATRDGLFHIRIQGLDPPVGAVTDSPSVSESTRTYLKYLNAFYVLLDSALVLTERSSLPFPEELSVRDLVIVTYDQDDKFQAITSLALGYASYLENARMLPRLAAGGLPMNDERLSGRVLVSTAVVGHANDPLSAASAQPRAFSTLSQLAKGLNEFNRGNVETAFTTLWVAIERIVIEWDHRHTGKADRNSTDFLGISKILSRLRNAGFVNVSLLDQIDRLRSIRNAIVHDYENSRCSASDCELAFAVLTEYLSSEHGVKVTLNTSRRLRMIG